MSKNGEQNSKWMLTILVLSVFAASANSLLFKAALNAFSSPTTNYGFFVSQFSLLLYILQAAVVSIIVGWRNPQTFRDVYQTPHIIFIIMGGLDSGSSTLGAIAGAYCPGEMQTLLNQLVIPLTMIGALIFLGSHFAGYQVWGSGLILFGAGFASSGYFFSPDATSSPDTAEGHVMGLPVAIGLYVISVIPSALSNIYKEKKMKELDMNEVHTSTIVSFWQVVIGFAFLPLMALPALGGLSTEEMGSQLSDGFACFMGTNPKDPLDDCSNSATLLLAYIVINFFYNVLLLAITKRGSAVLLVMSQALSLPITNIAFTLKPLMGEDAEPLTMLNLTGLVLVCIGFLAYSGFGFASNFMVAQGPPGQMAYAHFEDHDEVIVSAKVGTSPEELADFILGAVVKAHEEKHLRDHEQGLTTSSEGGEASTHLLGLEMGRQEKEDKGEDLLTISPLEASEQALKVLRDTVSVVEKHIRSLRAVQKSSGALKRGEGPATLPHITTPEIMKRYNAVTTNSPRSTRRPQPARGAGSGVSLLTSSTSASRAGQYDSFGNK